MSPASTAVLVLLLLILVFAVARHCQSQRSRMRRLRRQGMQGSRALAGRLAEQGWVLYTRPGCPFCENQMQVLGGSYPRSAVCSGESVCSAGVPTWSNAASGERRVGFQDAAALEKMAQRIA